MKYFLFVLSFVVIFIIGELLGLLMQCENSAQLRPAKHFIWLVPIIQVELFVYILIDAFKKRKFKMLIAFFCIGETGLIILSCISKEVVAIKAKTKAKPKKAVPIMRSTSKRARTAINAYA